MTKYEKRLFVLLDDYARRRHQCFVAEMFLNREKTAYILCFRPLASNVESADDFACRYIEVEAVDARNAGKAAALIAPMTQRLDKELSTLGRAP